MTDNIAAIRAAVDEITSKNAEKMNSFEAGLKAVNDSMDRLDNALKRVGPYSPDNDNGAPNPEALKAEHKAITNFVRTGDEAPLKEIHAAMSVGSDPDGGYIVLPAVSGGMTRKLFDAVTIRRLARVVSIETGSEWIEPVDSDESGATWVGETESRPETDTPQLKELRITLDEIYALQKVTQKLLDDSQYDIGGWVDDKITSKFSRSENAAFVNGDGVKKPRGFLTYDTAGTDDDARTWGTIQTINSAAATAIPNGDCLRNLYWKVRAPYRRNATWVMSSDTANSIDKIKGGDGEYMWRSAMTAGAQNSLLGLPVEFDEEMPAIGAGAFPIALADWKSAYTIVDRPGVKMLRDPYTSKPHVQFYAYRRVGGGLANSEAIKFLKIAA